MTLRLPDGRVELVETPAGRPSDLKLEITGVLSDSTAYQTLGDAENALLLVLRNGQLNALGLENNKGNLREVPTVQWAGLKFYFDPPRAGPVNIARIGATHWHDLKFSRSEVLRIWLAPKIEGSPNHTGRPTLAPEILEAFLTLAEEEKIDFNKPMLQIHKGIIQIIRTQKGDQTISRGLGKAAIQKVISKPFQIEKAKIEQSLKGQ